MFSRVVGDANEDDFAQTEALFTLETRSREENRPRAMAHSREAKL